MPRTNRQLLIALFSAFCLLWLSAFNAVQANSARPNQISHNVVNNYAADNHVSRHHISSDNKPIGGVHLNPVATADRECAAHTTSPHVAQHAKVEHQSCSSICIMKMPLEPINYAMQRSPCAIAPIGHDVMGKTISRTQSLFRPPIS